jgi:hypothetical protein
VLTGFWPAQGAISHVSIYTNGNARVPDGGATLLLLGIGLSGLAAARRWFVSWRTDVFESLSLKVKHEWPFDSNGHFFWEAEVCQTEGRFHENWRMC